MSWTKIKITRGSKEPLIFISRGKAKYVRFNSSFISSNKLEKRKSVDVFIDKTEKKVLVGFNFREDTEGTLKLAINDKGVGFISGFTVFRELQANELTKAKLDKVGKDGFKPKEDKFEDNKIFVIEIQKE